MGIAPELCAEDRSTQVSIGTLTDDVLLEIFDFYGREAEHDDWWHTLVHVRRRWRHVVFESPHRLKLRLFCTEVTPVRKMLDIWPALPLFISYDNPMSDVEDMDNVIAALEHSDRVCEIYLGDVPSPLLQQFAAVMQVPFPTLTSLELWTNTGSVLVLPNPLLGGYAPRLRTLRVDNLPIPVLRKLPLSSPDLVNLQLWKMSYVEPQTIVNCLAALTRLETFDLTFYFPPSRHHRTRRRPIPLTRVILPNLTSLLFKGDSEYLEDLVGQLSMPLLDHLSVILHNQLIFDMPQLPQFIRRTEKLKALTQANITFYDWLAEVRITGKTGTANDGTFSLGILCTNLDWQVASLAEVCGSCLHPLSTLEHLGIHQDRFWPLHWPDDMDNIPWLDLLRPFTTMKNLHLYKELTPRVVSALQELSGEGEIEVMPALECLLLEDPHPSGRIQEAIDQFVATRQLSGHPVAVRPLNGL